MITIKPRAISTIISVFSTIETNVIETLATVKITIKCFADLTKCV